MDADRAEDGRPWWHQPTTDARPTPRPRIVTQVPALTKQDTAPARREAPAPVAVQAAAPGRRHRATPSPAAERPEKHRPVEMSKPAESLRPARRYLKPASIPDEEFSRLMADNLARMQQLPEESFEGRAA